MDHIYSHTLHTVASPLYILHVICHAQILTRYLPAPAAYTTHLGPIGCQKSLYIIPHTSSHTLHTYAFPLYILPHNIPNTYSHTLHTSTHGIHTTRLCLPQRVRIPSTFDHMTHTTQILTCYSTIWYTPHKFWHPTYLNPRHQWQASAP